MPSKGAIIRLVRLSVRWARAPRRRARGGRRTASGRRSASSSSSPSTHGASASSTAIPQFAYRFKTPGAPFGGYKASGIGRETHKVILEHYTQMKNIMINLSESPSGFYPEK